MPWKDELVNIPTTMDVYSYVYYIHTFASARYTNMLSRHFLLIFLVLPFDSHVRLSKQFGFVLISSMRCANDVKFFIIAIAVVELIPGI